MLLAESALSIVNDCMITNPTHAYMLLAESALSIVNDWMITNPPQPLPPTYYVWCVAHPVRREMPMLKIPRARELMHKALWALTSSPGHMSLNFVIVLKRHIRELVRSQPLSIDDKHFCEYIEDALMRKMDKDYDHCHKLENEALCQAYGILGFLMCYHQKKARLSRLSLFTP